MDAIPARQLGIPGVQLFTSPVIHYNSSTLVEPLRGSWGGLYAHPVEHLYWVTTYRGVERKWGLHEYTTDRYSAVYGDIEVALCDGRGNGEASVLVVPLRADRGEGLLIPPGVWHTFRAVSEVAVLLNSKSPPYDAEKVDKKLRPLSELAGFVWKD